MTSITFYNPKGAKCAQIGEKCCKRRIPPTPICVDGNPPTGNPPTCEEPSKKCEDWGSEFKCLRPELCDPNTFATMASKKSPKSLPKDPSDLLTSLFNQDTQLFTQNADNGLAFNSDVSPCEIKQTACCKPLPVEEKCPEGTVGTPLDCQPIRSNLGTVLVILFMDVSIDGRRTLFHFFYF